MELDKKEEAVTVVDGIEEGLMDCSVGDGDGVGDAEGNMDDNTPLLLLLLLTLVLELG